eukprot:2271507-Rhodomonas_salina.3
MQLSETQRSATDLQVWGLRARLQAERWTVTREGQGRRARGGWCWEGSGRERQRGPSRRESSTMHLPPHSLPALQHSPHLSRWMVWECGVEIACGGGGDSAGGSGAVLLSHLASERCAGAPTAAAPHLPAQAVGVM